MSSSHPAFQSNYKSSPILATPIMADQSIKLYSILTKAKAPLSSVRVQVEVYGMYALPEAWLQAEGDYDYTVSFCGVKFSGGRIAKREPTEEELKAAEQGKKKQPPPARGKPVEPSAEELAALERERKLKEEVEAKRKAEWEALTEDERYYKTMEDIHQHGFLLWELEKEGDERKFKTAIQEKEHTGEELMTLEERIEDEGKLMLEFSKTPPSVDDDPKKKVKAKPGEEIKPIFAQAWVDMSFFRSPAAQETTFRIQLQDPEASAELPVFNNIRSYIFLRVHLDPPLTPSLPDTPFTSLTNLIPQRQPLPELPASLDASQDFRRLVKFESKDIASEYDEKFRESHDQDVRRFAVSQQKEMRERRKQDYLFEMNQSGKAHDLKEKLKKSVVRIAREKFRKEESLKGASANLGGRFNSELYAYLAEQINVCVDEFIGEKREELHEDLTVTRDLMTREKEQLLSQTMKETQDERLMRLVGECELVGDVKLAEQYMQQRACLQESSEVVWLDYARFCLRHGDITRAEECLKEVLSLSGSEVTVEHLVLFASLLLQRGRHEEAKYYLHEALNKDFYHIPANLITSLLYSILGQDSLCKKYAAIAKRLTLRHLGLLPPRKGIRTEPNASIQHHRFRVLTAQGEYTSVLTQDQVDDLYYSMFDYFLGEKLLHLAFISADFIAAKETSIAKFNFNMATIHYWKGEYEACSEILGKLLEFEPKHEHGWILRGHSQFHLGNHYDAEECYLKALRSAPKAGRKDTRSALSMSVDYSVHQRLGQIYLKRRSWKDAKQVFQRCCEENPTAFAWQGLGYACLRLEFYGEAEDALNQANMLDDKNPTTWLYLGLLCLHTTDIPPGRYVQAKECLSHALKFGANDPDLWLEVANLHIEKFFLEGAEPHVSKEDISEALQYYQLSTQMFSTQEKPVGDMVDKIVKTFEGLKSGADPALMQAIKDKKAMVLQTCHLQETES